MSITRYNPRTIHLGGDLVRVNDLPAAEILTPGHLIERADGAYQKHTAAAPGPLTLALGAPEMNKSIDDDYAADDLVFAGVFESGSTGYGWLASGENVADGDLLESAGDGEFKAKSSGVALARANEALDTTNGAARIRVEAI